MPASKEKIDRIMSRKYELINNCLLEAMNDFNNNKDIQQNRHILSPTSISCIINDYIREKFRKLEYDDPEMATLNDGMGFFITYRGIALRPKKVDKSLRSKNQPTSRVQKIKEQDYYLDGLEDNTVFLTLGYQLDVTSTSLRGVYIIFETPEINSWHLKIDNFSDMVQKNLDVKVTEEHIKNSSRVRIKEELLSSDIKEA